MALEYFSEQFRTRDEFKSKLKNYDFEYNFSFYTQFLVKQLEGTEYLSPLELVNKSQDKCSQ